MAGENEMRIIFGADTTPLRTEVSKATSTVDKFADSVEQAAGDATKGFEQLQKSVKGIPQAFDKVAGGSVVLTRIAGNLDAAGKAAIDSTKSFKVLEGAPLQTLDKLDAAIAQIRLSLANGFKANLDTSGLSPRVFAQVGSEAKQVKDAILSLALSLNQAIVESKAFGSTLEKQFHLGISEELQRAGVSVAAFKDALASLTGTGGANLTPLLQALDSIQAESSGTTTAIKSIGSALQGVSVLAKAPINDLVALDQELKVIKATLASGFQPSIEKIQITPADFTGVQNAVQGANESVENLGNTIRRTAGDSVKAFDAIENATTGIPQSLERAGAAADNLSRIGAEVDGISKAAKNGSTALEKFGKDPLAELNRLEAELKKVKAILSSGINANGLKGVTQSYSGVTRSAETAASATKKLSRESNAASSVFTDLGRVASDLPFGLIGIANNITPLIESFRRLAAESKGATGFFRNLGSSLVGGGGLILAFSAVTAAIQIAQYGIMGFGRKTKEADDSTKELLKSLKAVSDISGETKASVEGEIAKVSALAAAVLDTNKSYKERKNALEQLHDVNKNHFGDLTLEAKSLATLTSRVTEYTNALIAQETVKAFGEEIGKVNKALFDQNKLLDNSKTKMHQAQKALDDFNLEQSNRRAAGLPETTSDQIEQIKLFRAARITTDAFNEQRDAIDKVSTNLADLNGGLQDAIANSLKFKSITGGGGGTKEDAQLKTLKQQLDELQGKLEKINKLREAGVLPKFKEDDAENLAKKILDVLQQIDAREVEIKLKPKLEIDPELNELEIDKIEADANKRLAFTKMQAPLSLVIDTKGVISQAQGAANEALKRIGIAEALTPGESLPLIDIKAIEKTIGQLQEAGVKSGKAFREGFKTTYKGFAEDLQKNVAQALNFQTQFEKIQSDFNSNVLEAIKQGVTNMFVGIGEALGQALAGEKFNPLQSVLGGIADMLGTIGKIAIQTGVAMIFLKKALNASFSNPAALIAAGVGLVALSEFAKSKINSSVPKFAEGGIVRGPTMGLLGEAGPEMVIPLNRANQFLDGSAATKVQVEGLIRGQDIYLSQSRFISSNNKR